MEATTRRLLQRQRRETEARTAAEKEEQALLDEFEAASKAADAAYAAMESTLAAVIAADSVVDAAGYHDAMMKHVEANRAERAAARAAGDAHTKYLSSFVRNNRR